MDEVFVNTELSSFVDSIKDLTNIEDGLLTDEVMKITLEQIKQSLEGQSSMQIVNDIIKNLDAQGATRKDAKNAIDILKQTLNNIIYKDVEYKGNKKILVDSVLESTYALFDKAIEKYHLYSIELPMTLDATTDAQEPTYAHDTDAAADIYAIEHQVIPAHSYGNLIRTGVKIQLPEGWLAMIIPRSSMGLKTPLRLSNSIGLIDSGYRGELGVIYDNTSDEAYTVEAGDRIAQLLVMPSYRFKANIVDVLTDSDRGEGGFGASGK